MPIFEHSKKFDDAVLFARLDTQHPLATVSPPGFVLEEQCWLTAEHYYQASKQKDLAYAQKIFLQQDALQAHKLGNAWFKRKRPDFKQVRNVLMTRALYCKAKQNQEVAEHLLDTGERLIVETSQFDPYWGIGRDQRGLNTLGKIWMDIRNKLRQGSASNEV